jgi:transcription elongation GreA/GreB family factor
MKNKNQVQAIKDFIETAEKSLKNAKKLLQNLIKDNNIDFNKTVDMDVS